MQPDQGLAVGHETVTGLAPNVLRRLVCVCASLSAFRYFPSYARRLLKVASPGLLRAGFKRSAHWAHPAAALFAFATDVVKPMLPHCTVWVFLAMLAGLACLVLLVRRKMIATEVGTGLIVFCLMTALLSMVVIGLQRIVGEEGDGAFAKVLPGIEEMQKSLGIVGTKLDAMQQSQQQEAALAAARHAEEMKILSALQENYRSTIEALSRDKGVPIAALIKILARLGETTISNDPMEIEYKLAQKADEFLRLRQQVVLLSGDDPHVHTLQREAEVALDNSDFELARTKLRQAAEIDRAAVLALTDRAKTRALEAAQSLDKSASVAILTLHYRAAEEDLADAVKLAMPYDRHGAWWLMTKQAGALLSQGDEFGDNTALTESIGIYQGSLALVSRTDETQDWATAQNNLGNALAALGERESGTAHLEEAVAAFRSALKERRRDRVPLAWAESQNNLGLVLATLGKRESGTAHLTEAVAALRSALKERRRDRAPLAWAESQNNLGLVLATLGERESGTAHLTEAVVAFRAALTEHTRDRVPLEWATAQNNLGNALQTLGERESGTAHLEEAVAAYRSTLTERTRDRVPLLWAATQINLGNALQRLGERESGTARLAEAVAAYRASLTEITRDRAPLDWATAQNDFGSALTTLGGRESGTAHLTEAVVAFRAALTERTRDRVPLLWAATQMNLGTALGSLGDRESGTAHLEEAAAAFHAALTEQTRERVPLLWAMTQMNLGTALGALGGRESGTAHLEEAVVAFRAALTENTRERVPLEWATAQNNLGFTLAALGKRERGTTRLKEAVTTWEACLRVTKAIWPREKVESILFQINQERIEISKRSSK
jgi:tetratricopeptide (TPR) repeat protein